MFRFPFFLWVFCFGCLASIHGESISGEITDPSRSPVPGVRLSLFQGLRSVAGTVTDHEGRFSFDRLNPGIYLLCVDLLGFQQEYKELHLESGQTLREDVTLSLTSIREKVVVTATRTETPTSLLGNSVSVLTEDEIRRQRKTNVADLLRNLPGINIVQTGEKGGLTSGFLRGAPSNYTKVFLDGIALNQPGGDLDLANLSTANIERIEVVRGPQSALYGSDAIGGVIQIFTKKTEESGSIPDFDLAVEGGNYHSGSAVAAVRGLYRRINYSLAWQQESTRNQHPNGYFRNQTLSTHIGMPLFSKSVLDLVGRTERGKHGVAGPTFFGPADLDAFTRKRDHAFRVAWQYEPASFWQQKLSYSQSYSNQLSDNPIDSGCFTPQFAGHTAPFPYCDYPYSSLNATHRRTAHYQSTLLLSSHIWTMGMEWEDQRGRIGDTSAHRLNRGYYLQDQFLLFPRLSITGGIRWEDNQSFGFAVIPRVSVAYLLRKGSPEGIWGVSRAKFNFGYGIKEPSFLESFSSNFFYQGNPDLKPEKSRSYEIGWEQALAGNRLQIETNAFFNRFQNQIALRTLDWVTYQAMFFNIGRSQAWGMESTARTEPIRNLRISGNYTYLNTKVLDSTSPFNALLRTGAPLLRRPRHSGSLTTTWDRRRWMLQTNLTLIGRRADGDFYGLGLTTISGYAKWDMSAALRITPQVEFYTVMENLLNCKYFEVQGYPSPKIHFRTGLRYHWGR